MTLSNGNIFRVTGPSPFTGEFPSQTLVMQSLMFALICAWTNGRVNNRDTAYLRDAIALIIALLYII